MTRHRCHPSDWPAQIWPAGAWSVVALPLLALLVGATAAAAQPAPAPTRGQLLYGNHCIACHSAQVHWRDQTLAKDWPSLRELVRQWQARERLDWSDADITEVARHLNDTIYRYTGSGERVGAADGAQRRARSAVVVAMASP